MEGTPKLILTADGSHTLQHEILNETYHSVFGALVESKHIFIGGGLHSLSKPSIRIFEMGFGTGLNAFLSLIESLTQAIKIEYVALEKYPLEPPVYATLNYGELCGYQDLFLRLHQAPWGQPVPITPGFILQKHASDLLEFDPPGIFDLVYFDAFSPDKQPELWTPAVFRRLYKSLKETGCLVTYSSKGLVKRALREAGFSVERHPGPPGKRHFLKANITSRKENLPHSL